MSEWVRMKLAMHLVLLALLSVTASCATSSHKKTYGDAIADPVSHSSQDKPGLTGGSIGIFTTGRL